MARNKPVRAIKPDRDSRTVLAAAEASGIRGGTLRWRNGNLPRVQGDLNVGGAEGPIPGRAARADRLIGFRVRMQCLRARDAV